MSIRKTSDGTWLVRGKVKNRSGGSTYYYKSGFKRKTDASNWEKCHRLQVQSDKSSSRFKEHNLGTIFDWNIKSGPDLVEKAASTFSNERKIYKKWIQPYLGNLYIEQLTAKRIQEWWKVIHEIDACSQYKKSILAVLSSLFYISHKTRSR